MSVLVVSRQMISDANKKASSFVNSYVCSDEKGMCPTLGKMKKIDREEFFLRLYFYNFISYDIRYGKKWTDGQLVLTEWENIRKSGDDINIFNFLNILYCLRYNIEFSRMSAEGFSHPCFKKDEKLLNDVIRNIESNIAYVEIKKRGIRWTY